LVFAPEPEPAPAPRDRVPPKPAQPMRTRRTSKMDSLPPPPARTETDQNTGLRGQPRLALTLTHAICAGKRTDAKRLCSQCGKLPKDLFEYLEKYPRLSYSCLTCHEAPAPVPPAVEQPTMEALEEKIQAIVTRSMSTIMADVTNQLKDVPSKHEVIKTALGQFRVIQTNT